MKFIIIDIGSTFIKAALYHLDQEQLLDRMKYPTPARKPNGDPYAYENDGEEFVNAVKDIIRSYSKKYQDVAGVLLSTQQHGCVLRHPALEKDVYISWQDTRCLKKRPGAKASYLQELTTIFSRSDMERNGVYIKPALALCNLYALFEERRLECTKETRIDTLGSYIIEALTGNSICHITNAAPMGFADILDNTWRMDMLERLNLHFVQLPRITNQMECCGFFREEGICLAVFPDVGDVQTSVYGAGASNHDLVINIGTGGQLIYVSDQYCPGDYEVRPFYDNRYCNVISRMPGGRNFDVQINYMREIGEKIFHCVLDKEEIWERLNSMDMSMESGSLEVDCGFYELPDRLAGGGVSHINHENFRIHHMLWATALDFGKKYKEYARVLCKEGSSWKRVFFAGGAVLKNPMLQRAIQLEMGLEEPLLAPEDEVFEGMKKLVRQCSRVLSDRKKRGA